mmetsp:Transcript_75647/g.191276  ORF Transcript_75647/g.191276 Transcript_75647/m.191276 type:complete len:221 (+) Transcript_75647:301-963(+)
MHLGRHQGVAESISLDATEDKLVDLLDVAGGNDSLLLSRVGDLRDRGNRPVVGLLSRLVHAAVVAVADGINPAVALLISGPSLALPGLHGQSHVHQDPSSATRPLLAEGLGGHEVVRSLNTDADVLLVRATREADAAVEVGILGVVFHVVELLDTLLLHVLRAIGSSLGWQRAQALGQRIDDGEPELGKKVLQLSDPLYTDEACTHDQDLGTLLVEPLDR